MTIRENIVETASELFFKRGPKLVTMDDVVSANGISKRTIYTIFPDKNALLAACVRRQIEKRAKQMEEIYNESSNILEFMLKLHLLQFQVKNRMNPEFFRDLKRYYPSVFNEIVLEMREKMVEDMIGTLKLGQEQGLFRKNIKVRMMAVFMTEVAEIINAKEFSYGDGDTSREGIREAYIVFLRGIATQEGIQIVDEYLEKNENNNI